MRFSRLARVPLLLIATSAAVTAPACRGDKRGEVAGDDANSLSLLDPTIRKGGSSDGDGQPLGDLFGDVLALLEQPLQLADVSFDPGKLVFHCASQRICESFFGPASGRWRTGLPLQRSTGR